MRISDWSSDVCSSDLLPGTAHRGAADRLAVHIVAERDVVERIVGLDQDDRKADRLIGSGPDPDGLPVILAQPVLGGGRGRAAHRDRDADALPPDPKSVV